MPDSITRSAVLAAPPRRVWSALADAQEFGTWFRARFDAPYAPGAEIIGAFNDDAGTAHPGSLRIHEMIPERRLSFEWDADEPGKRTLVAFELEPEGEGTRLTVTESGFDRLSPETGEEMARRNAKGWEIQLGRIAAHVG